MIVSYPNLWKAAVGITLATVAVSTLIAPGAWVGITALVLILFVGIPHGAADHQIFQQLFLKNYQWRDLVLFYSLYLGLMGLVVFLWWQLPIVALVLFLVLSAYHFGQANFHYLDQHKWTNRALFFLWGSWVIATPVLFHFATAQQILEELLQRPLATMEQSYALVIIGGLTLVLVALSLVTLERRFLGRELVTLVSLVLLFLWTPLLLGFGLFFAVWHALPSALDQIRFFRQRNEQYTLLNYIKAILPYSILAIVSIIAGLMLFDAASFGTQWQLIFTAIAALTLPHMLLLENVYQKLQELE